MGMDCAHPSNVCACVYVCVCMCVCTCVCVCVHRQHKSSKSKKGDKVDKGDSGADNNNNMDAIRKLVITLSPCGTHALTLLCCAGCMYVCMYV